MLGGPQVSLQNREGSGQGPVTSAGSSKGPPCPLGLAVREPRAQHSLRGP